MRWVEDRRGVLESSVVLGSRIYGTRLARRMPVAVLIFGFLGSVALLIEFCAVRFGALRSRIKRASFAFTMVPVAVRVTCSIDFLLEVVRCRHGEHVQLQLGDDN